MTGEVLMMDGGWILWSIWNQGTLGPIAVAGSETDI